MVSSEGSAVAVGDVNNDGFEDMFSGLFQKGKKQVDVAECEGEFKDKTSAIILDDINLKMWMRILWT